MVKLSVVLPTHNPRAESLARVLAALKIQTLAASEWEMLVVDNASTYPIDLGGFWRSRARVFVESQLGLTHARLRGIAEAKGLFIVWVDDDNVLATNYLEAVLEAFEKDSTLGAIGGKSIPEYEVLPPSWFFEGIAPLGCRDLGDEAIYMSWQRDYPSAAPIGAGLAIRRDAMQRWAEAVRLDPKRQSFGRKGGNLTSGEDNDICLTVLQQGLRLAYLPQLKLIHLISAGRLEKDYLARIARVSYRDFVRVLDLHEVRRWQPVTQWGFALRAFRAYFVLRAWRGPANYIRWSSAIGQFEGRTRLRRRSS